MEIRNEELLKLLREVVMREHLALPENNQDAKWFDDGGHSNGAHEFRVRLYEVLNLGDMNKKRLL
jgi:hypothetical protein